MNDNTYQEILNKLKVEKATSREQLKKLFKLDKKQKEILDLYIELEKYWAYKSGYGDGQTSIRKSIKSILEIEYESDY